jgi:hypothetical protein
MHKLARAQVAEGRTCDGLMPIHQTAKHSRADKLTTSNPGVLRLGSAICSDALLERRYF